METGWSITGLKHCAASSWMDGVRLVIKLRSSVIHSRTFALFSHKLVAPTRGVCPIQRRRPMSEDLGILCMLRVTWICECVLCAWWIANELCGDLRTSQKTGVTRLSGYIRSLEILGKTRRSSRLVSSNPDD